MNGNLSEIPKVEFSMREEFRRWADHFHLTQEQAASMLGTTREVIGSFEGTRATFPRGPIQERMVQFILGYRRGREGEMIPDITCSKCMHRVPGFGQGAKYCLFCGTPLGPKCPSCDAVNLLRQPLCGECGSAMEKTETRISKPRKGKGTKK